MEEASVPSEQSWLDLIAEAYTDRPDDADAAREEASLLRFRRQLLRRTSARMASGEVIELPPPPPVVHLRSPRVVYEEGSPRLPAPIMEEKKTEE